MLKKVKILPTLFGLSSFVAICLFISLSSMPNLANSQTIDPPEDDEQEEPGLCPNPDKVRITCSEGMIDCTPKNC